MQLKRPFRNVGLNHGRRYTRDLPLLQYVHAWAGNIYSSFLALEIIPEIARDTGP